MDANPGLREGETMNKISGRIAVGICSVAALCATSALAQSDSDSKQKAPMYSYVGNWAVPRAQWGEMEKNNLADEKILSKALAAGTIVGYGNDVTLVHTEDGVTHDDWWSANSLAGIINILEQFYSSGGSTAPVLSAATKHYDNIYVSRHYNWHPGTYKNVYTHAGQYKLKKDAATDAVNTLSKTILVPFFEKLLSDGAIHEYEIDTQAIHTESPDMFYIVYIAANAEGLDKVDAALTEALKGNPLIGPTFGSMTESSGHRDQLARTTATYK
jgi:hypothetical protein